MSAKEATNIGLELAGALAAVHRAGLIHRDVKAQNVMREGGGRIVLMDLGASLSETPLVGEALQHGAVGTPTYMAPELFEFEPATRESDIYSLGVLLYFLVSGEFPVQAPSIEALRTAHRARQSRSLRDVRPDLPRAFVEVVTRMIAHDRGSPAGDSSAIWPPPRAQKPRVAVGRRRLAIGDGRRRLLRDPSHASVSDQPAPPSSPFRCRPDGRRVHISAEALTSGFGSREFTGLLRRPRRRAPFRDHQARLSRQARATCCSRKGPRGGDRLGMSVR